MKVLARPRKGIETFPKRFWQCLLFGTVEIVWWGWPWRVVVSHDGKRPLNKSEYWKIGMDFRRGGPYGLYPGCATILWGWGKQWREWQEHRYDIPRTSENNPYPAILESIRAARATEGHGSR